MANCLGGFASRILMFVYACLRGEKVLECYSTSPLNKLSTAYTILHIAGNYRIAQSYDQYKHLPQRLRSQSHIDTKAIHPKALLTPPFSLTSSAMSYYTKPFSNAASPIQSIKQLLLLIWAHHSTTSSSQAHVFVYSRVYYTLHSPTHSKTY